MHPGAGHHVPFFVLSLRLPAHASSAETNLASVIARRACGPLPTITCSHLPLCHLFFHCYSIMSPFPPAEWFTVEGTSVRAAAASVFVSNPFKSNTSENLTVRLLFYFRSGM
ncbi:hypothetical protein AMECASPLE_012856 [Ameca splendens]|uniref:Secreted protein n=1 Tax=Ameca splendens TaxID=208324 RepID=A0ABV0ZAI8_9TELE